LNKKAKIRYLYKAISFKLALVRHVQK